VAEKFIITFFEAKETTSRIISMLVDIPLEEENQSDVKYSTYRRLFLLLSRSSELKELSKIRVLSELYLSGAGVRLIDDFLADVEKARTALLRAETLEQRIFRGKDQIYVKGLYGFEFDDSEMSIDDQVYEKLDAELEGISQEIWGVDSKFCKESLDRSYTQLKNSLSRFL